MFWNGEYELVHPSGWVEKAEESLSMLAVILMLLPISPTLVSQSGVAVAFYPLFLVG